MLSYCKIIVSWANKAYIIRAIVSLQWKVYEAELEATQNRAKVAKPAKLKGSSGANKRALSFTARWLEYIAYEDRRWL